MKIPSHTGNMVDARVGMHYRPEALPNDVYEIVAIGARLIQGINRVTGEARYDDGMYCTMLHCPFQVGDAGQQYMPSWVDDAYPCEWYDWEISEGGIEDFNNGSLQLRHASLDLRDAPDYKPAQPIHISAETNKWNKLALAEAIRLAKQNVERNGDLPVESVSLTLVNAVEDLQRQVSVLKIRARLAELKQLRAAGGVGYDKAILQYESQINSIGAGA